MTNKNLNKKMIVCGTIGAILMLPIVFFGFLHKFFLKDSFKFGQHLGSQARSWALKKIKGGA